MTDGAATFAKLSGDPPIHDESGSRDVKLDIGQAEVSRDLLEILVIADFIQTFPRSRYPDLIDYFLTSCTVYQDVQQIKVAFAHRLRPWKTCQRDGYKRY